MAKATAKSTAQPKTMLVRRLVPGASPDEALPTGHEYEVNSAEAVRLIEDGQVEAVATPSAGKRQATA